MNFFNIEGKNYEEAKKAIEDNRTVLETSFADGDMKAGRYLGILYIMEAAARGDITSQVALGNLYELGSIVDQDNEEAVRWYRAAIAQDHPKRDGTMLAAGATKGMARLGRS
jgi:TPR repeat protein